MMNREMMIEALEALKEDVFYYVNTKGNFSVTLEDFEGFDDNWNEITRDFDDKERVDSFLEMLHTKAISIEKDFYVVYHFEGFDVQLGYASFDI